MSEGDAAMAGPPFRYWPPPEDSEPGSAASFLSPSPSKGSGSAHARTPASPPGAEKYVTLAARAAKYRASVACQTDAHDLAQVRTPAPSPRNVDIIRTFITF